VITSGSVTSLIYGLGIMERHHWKEPAPSVVQTQEPKTNVSLWLKAAVGLKRTEAVEFSMRSLARSRTWRASCRCCRPATYQGEYPRYMNVASPRSVTRRKRHVTHN
jgi:hypothetical protein